MYTVGSTKHMLLYVLIFLVSLCTKQPFWELITMKNFKTLMFVIVIMHVLEIELCYVRLLVIMKNCDSDYTSTGGM